MRVTTLISVSEHMTIVTGTQDTFNHDATPGVPAGFCT